MTEDHQQQQQTQQQHSQSPKERKSIHDIRNQDFVSRLLAATPPYLYSTPVGTNNFFFSDMLRSLVQARNNENARNIQMQQQAAIARRPRKRSWSQHRPYYDHLRDRKELEEKLTSEKPLELTNKQLFPIASKYSKSESTNKDFNKIPIPSMCDSKIISPSIEFNQSLTNSETSNSLNDASAASIQPSSDLVLPPPPPVWYPPLYPPYGIDPLHFFIDLRVSGHIYDRKKDNPSPLANSDNNNMPTADNELGKQRTGSAFTVPLPRSETKTSTAINLSASSNAIEKTENYSKYYDLGDTKENHPNSNANYVLQNLPRLYNQFAGKEENNSCYENDNKSELDCDDLQNGPDNSSGHIDVEILDSIKFRSDNTCGAGSRSETHSPDDQIVHEID